VVDGVHHIRIRGYSAGHQLPVNLVKDLEYATRAVAALPAADILVTNTFWAPVLAAWRRKVGKGAVHVQRMPKGQCFLYRRATRIHTVSEAIRRAIVEECPNFQQKIRVIHNPIDTNTFIPSPKPKSSSSQTILYTGRIHPEKGLELLAAAGSQLANSHPGLSLKLVGPSTVASGGGGNVFVDKLFSLGKGYSLEICDPVYDRDELAKVYHSANVYCYPSIAGEGEASPVAPVEAMATGLAPVVSAIPQFRDTVVHGTNGLVFDHYGPAAVENLAKALGYMLSNPARARDMGLAASITASERSYYGVAVDYLADFSEMLGK
jgi:glycosyltransferase involved in cell wall biosynthesis